LAFIAATKAGMAARVMVREAGSGAVFRGHQRQVQHFAAGDFTADAHAGEHTLHFLGVADGDGQPLIQRLLGVQHHHGGHQLGHRGDRHLQVGVAGVEHLVSLEVDQQGAAGGEFLGLRRRLGDAH